jgi:hypothetical protein
MGHVNKLKFHVEERSIPILDNILRSAPHFARYDEEGQLYEFRVDPSERDMPEATAEIEPYGLELNALYNYNIYGAVQEYLVREIERTLGVKTELVL